jgi:hypothetical protein
MAGEFIASTVDLSPEVTGAITTFVGELDKTVSDGISPLGRHGFSREDLVPILSMYPICGMSNDLVIELREAGVTAELLINHDALEIAQAIERRTSVIDFDPFRKKHIVARVTTDTTELYIDCFWQQFLCDLGQTASEVERHINTAILPTERVICYQAKDVDLLAGWFAQLARVMQNRAKNGTLGGDTNMFTRPCTDLDMLLNRNAVTPPVPFYSIEGILVTTLLRVSYRKNGQNRKGLALRRLKLQSLHQETKMEIIRFVGLAG